MKPHHHAPHDSQSKTPTTDQLLSEQVLPEQQTRNCPYCNEQISLHARKCWRCHEYFSLPLDDLDDRAYQFARREVLQDCVLDIKKWITRIGCGSIVALGVMALLSMLRFQDVLEQMVADRVHKTAGPVLVATEEKLAESDDILDDVQDKIRLAQHRISQFDWLNDKLSETESAVLKVETARLGLESRAETLGHQFGQLENRFIHAKRELRDDRDRRVEELLGNFANQVVTVNKLEALLANSENVAHQQLLESLTPLKHQQIGLVSPFSLSVTRPTVLFSPSVRLTWQFGHRDVGEVTYRVHYDNQQDFQSGHAQTTTTRLTHHVLSASFPHGPVFWRVEAVAREGQVLATSDVGHFEFYTDSIDRIRQTGIVRVGVAYASQGEFAYFDEEQGRLSGYDIELARWLASRLMPNTPGIEPVFLNYEWRQLLKSVTRNEVDLIISTITITPEREEEYGLQFSHPYYKTMQACVVLKESGIRTAAQIRGRRLAVQTGTSSETVATAFTESENLYRSASSEASFDALLRGKVDAIVTDYDFAQGDVRKLGQAAAVIPLEESDFPADYDGIRSEEYGIAVAKPETYLLTRINNAIETATRGNILESLKLRFVTGNPALDTHRAPPLEVASPFPGLAPNPNPLRR